MRRLLFRTSYQKYSPEVKEAIAFSQNSNLFPDLQIPNSTAKEWIKNGLSAQISQTAISLIKQEKLKKKVEDQKQEINELKTKIKLIKNISDILGTSLKNMRIKDSETKKSLIEIISKYQNKLTQDKILKTLSLSKSKLRRWRISLEIESSKDKTEYVQQYPMSITEDEFSQMKSLCEDKRFAHFPISSLHYYVKRENLLHCPLNTWHHFSKKYNFTRPYVKNYIKEYKEGIPLNIPSNITLFPLPPYSPELNPMEQVWQKIKGDNLTNTTFKNYNDIVENCSKAWNSFCDKEGNINKLCSRAWAR